MPLQTRLIPEETAAPVSPSSVRLADTAETVHLLPKGAVAEALESAENAEQKRRVAFGIYYTITTIVALLFIGSLVATVASAVFHLTPDVQKNIMYFWAAVFTFNAFCTNPMARSWVTRYDRAVYDAAVKLLPATNDLGRLLPFVDSLRAHQTPDERRQLYPALTEMLWNLPSSDATLLLDAPRRAALRNALTGSYAIMANFKRQSSDWHFDDPTCDLAVAIMKTLASIGDKKSVKALQKIINADAKTPNDTVVRDAAREYLPVLQQKIAENTAMRIKIRSCLLEKIRDPQKVLGEFLDTVSYDATKTSLVEFLRIEKGNASHWQVLLTSGVMSLAFACSPPFQHVSNTFSLLIIFFAFVATNLLFLGMFSADIGYTRHARKVAYELTRRANDDKRLIPFLLDYAKGGIFPNGKTHDDMAKKTLARLLPLLQPGDAALVPPAQRAYLRSWLKLPRRNSKRGGKGNNSQTLAILALNALGTIGDTKALPAAEAIARRTAHGNYHEADLHEAALRCVDALRMRKG